MFSAVEGEGGGVVWRWHRIISVKDRVIWKKKIRFGNFVIYYIYWTPHKSTYLFRKIKLVRRIHSGNVWRTWLEWNTDKILVTQWEETKNMRERDVHWFPLKLILINWRSEFWLELCVMQGTVQTWAYVNMIINFLCYTAHQQEHISKIYFVFLYITFQLHVLVAFATAIRMSWQNEQNIHINAWIVWLKPTGIVDSILSDHCGNVGRFK